MNKLKYLLVPAILIGFLTASFFLPIGQWILSLVNWAQGAGFAGMLVYGLVYVVATVAMIPGLLLTLGAGFLYGPLAGFALVSPASVLGATLAFLLGRFALRDWVQQRIAKYPKFAAIDRAIGREGLKIVFLLRLSPIFPFNLLNYSLGLTKIPPAQYVLASFIGMIPGTFMYIYLGSIATSISQIVGGETPDAGPWQTALYWAGLVATILVTVYVTKIARKALKKELEK